MLFILHFFCYRREDSNLELGKKIEKTFLKVYIENVLKPSQAKNLKLTLIKSLLKLFLSLFFPIPLLTIGLL